MFAHLCSGGGIVLPSVSAVGVEHRAPFGRRRRVCLEGRFASGVSFLRRADGTDTSIVHLHLQPTPGIPFFIRGKNPTDNVASNYISTAVDPAFRDFAWMIAKHESRTWSANGQRVYNQFNPRGSIQEHPMKGENEIKDSTVVTNWGWGICQIDRGPTGTVSRIVYDWRHNVDEMNSVLREKRAIYRTLVGYYRQTYQNDSSVYWVEPDALVTNVNGIAVSAEKWAVMTLYNGSKGLPAPEIGAFGVQKTPLVFDPETSTWRFHTNSKNYVPNVLQSAGLTEVE